jgi:hypothetical protein
MSIPIYLLECHTWSDGEDDHEEDHNYYYDIKYFYLMDSKNYKCIYSWNAQANIESGLIMEVTDLMNCCELDQERIYQAAISLENAKEQIRKYMNSTTIHDPMIIDIALEFLRL